MIDIVIPTMWMAKDFDKALSTYTEHPEVNKIIIIDNCRKDRPDYDALKHPKVELVSYGRNIYVNPAWNEGYTRSTSDILAIINDDINVSHNIFDMVTNFGLKSGDLIGVNLRGRQDNYKIDEHIETKEEIVKLNYNKNNPIGGQAWAFGICMFMLRESYSVIPQLYQIWYGDDYLAQRASSVYAINSNKIKGKISETLRKFNDPDDEISKRIELDSKNLLRFNDFKSKESWDIPKNMISMYESQRLQKRKSVGQWLDSFKTSINTSSDYYYEVNMKYSIFHLQGGIGKHVAATAIAKVIKNNHPDRKLIVVCAYPEIFNNLDFVDRVYQLGATSYFYQNYIQDKDSIIFYHEPYYTTDHIHKKLPLIQNWCKLYGLEYKDEQPVIKFNKIQYDLSKKFWVKGSKPVMLLHTNGGMMAADAKPYSWTRDMPEDVGQALVDHYKKDYAIYQVTKINSPKLKGANHVFATAQQSLSLMEFFSVLLHSDKRILIDSSLQHAAAALKKPSTVLWNGTSPTVFGYDIHTNITTKIPHEFKLPGSYLFDFDFNGNEVEYPFTEDQELFNVDEIIASVDAQ